MIRALHTRAYMIGRSSGKSAAKASAYRGGCSVVAAAAYRANDRIKADDDGRIHDYTRKSGVVFSQIMLPGMAPERFKDRSTLWNEVERVENRKNSQFARQWEASFPPGFSREEQIALASKFAQDYFVSSGMIADLAIHDKPDRWGGRNAHVHVLLTLRRVNEHGFVGNKVREWNSFRTQYNFTEMWRVAWAERCNELYRKIELPDRIDPRRYELQQNGLIPTKPIGKFANQLEKQGIRTRKGDENRRIEIVNQKTIQNNIYDLATKQPLNDVERKEVVSVQFDYETWKRQYDQTDKELRQAKAKVDELGEIMSRVSEMESLVVQYRGQDDERKASQIEKSLLQIEGYLKNKYDITPPELFDAVQDYYAAFEEVAGRYYELTKKQDETEEKTQDADKEIEQEQEQEQERVREREKKR